MLLKLRVISMRRLLLALVIISVSVVVLWQILLRYYDYWRPSPIIRLETPWTWVCEQRICIKRGRSPSLPVVSLASCQMVCGQPPLWPYPTGTTRLGNTSSAFHLGQIAVDIKDAGPRVSEALQQAASVFRRNLRSLYPVGAKLPTDINELSISLIISTKKNNDLKLTLNTDESYRLVVSHVSNIVGVRVYGNSFFGVRHGLETLSQLVWWDQTSLRILNDVFVVDQPRFPYRGLMVDTSRNFMPIATLKVTIDAMAASKLNAFHWHMSDSQSFPFASPRVPNMSIYGAYSPEKTYSANDVKELTKYALIRGVRIIPEIDAPAHAGNGWQWGPESGLGKLSLCVNEQPWQEYCGQPPCGQLNPDNQHSYRVLGDLYRDLVELTNTTDVFHLGGDEVNVECWRRELWGGDVEYVETQFFDKWLSFETRALEKLKVAYGENSPPSTVVVWSSELTLSGKLDNKTFAVQVWSGSNWQDTNVILSHGYRIIISHVDAWYLDCGLGDYRKPGEGACGPYSNWQTVYLHRPWRLFTPDQYKRVLGGEVCLWTERSDAQVLDSRLWPRASALAERLWSDPVADIVPASEVVTDGLNDKSLLRAHHRISLHRERLVSRGVRADPVQPEWCQQNPFMCF